MNIADQVEDPLKEVHAAFAKLEAAEARYNTFVDLAIRLDAERGVKTTVESDKISAVCMLLDFGSVESLQGQAEEIMNFVTGDGWDSNWQLGMAADGNRLELVCSQTYTVDGVVRMREILSNADLVRLFDWLFREYVGELVELWFDPDWREYRFLSETPYKARAEADTPEHFDDGRSAWSGQ